jgi:hypothetical protein
LILRTTRGGVLVLALAAATLVGCSSSGSPSSNSPRSNPPSSRASTTTSALPQLPTTAPGNPDETPNPIPFDVGELAARSNGWRIGVTRVVRPLNVAGLPSLPAGEEYVGVDITMINDGPINDGFGPVAVNTRRIFGLNDQTGRGHAAVAGPKGTTGLDGSYAPGTKRTGRMIFAVPVGKQLLMLLDGPAIHTQRTIFQIDPPNHPAVD